METDSSESRFMEPLQLAGRLIMENGGETYRVEETILRMGHAFGLSQVDSFAVPSGIFISYRKSDGTMETSVTRVHSGETNLTKVDTVNAVSRNLEKGSISFESAVNQLRQLAEPGCTHAKMLILGSVLSAAGFAVMFGGEIWSCIFAALTGFVVEILLLLLQKYHMHSLISTLAGSFINALLPMLLNKLTGLGVVEAMVAGALMPLLPGLAMTNAVQDTMRGDMVSGLSHGISALLTAALIAFGTLMASLAFKLLPGIAAADKTVTYNPNVAIQCVTMFISSMIGTYGFAMLFHAPQKAWLPAASIGALGYVIYWVMMHFGIGEPAAMLAATVAASILAQICARHMRMIATIFVALSIIPLVPGLGLYRCLAAFAVSDFIPGIQTLVATMVSFVMISIGLGMGSFIYRAASGGSKKHIKK